MTATKTPNRKRVSLLWNREYETRELDKAGDVVNVHHFETEAAAAKEARELVKAGVCAAVVEYHVTKLRSASNPKREHFREIVAYGYETAIRAFGWEGTIEILR